MQKLHDLPGRMSKGEWESLKRELNITDKDEPRSSATDDREVYWGHQVPDFRILRNGEEALSRTLLGSLAKAKDIHTKLLSLKEQMLILRDPKKAPVFESSAPAWTNTGIVYEAPDKPFGEYVKFEGMLVEIPLSFRGSINMALVFPELEIKFWGEVAQFSRNFYEIPFPREDGFYFPDEVEMVPRGEKLDEADTRGIRLSRLDQAYAGAVVAQTYGPAEERRMMAMAGYNPEMKMGMIAAEA